MPQRLAAVSDVCYTLAEKPDQSNQSQSERGDNSMQELKKMLLGIAIMVASVAFYPVYDNDMVAVLIALIGLCISVYGYAKKEK